MNENMGRQENGNRQETYESLKRKAYTYFLISVPGIGNVAFTKLMERFRDVERIYRAKEDEVKDILNDRQLREFFRVQKSFDPMKELEELRKKGIGFVTKWDREYPGRLKNIPDAPYGIFYAGELPRDNILSVAVIGARDCSEYGKYVAVELGRSLADKGIDVISGMARGIDGISQRAALDAGGRSYAVLGCGVDICYPGSNREIYEKLKKQGGIISTYPPKTEPRPQNFPPRNRIVSGLADVLVVIEARQKSGTLITVDMALEQGKEVFVVPGRVTDRLSDGCNRLLRQGAGVFLSPDDFVEEIMGAYGDRGCLESLDGCAKQEIMKLKNKELMDIKNENNGNIEEEQKGNHDPGLSWEEKKVLDFLDFTPQNVEMLCEKINKQIQNKNISVFHNEKVMILLMKLAMEGYAVQISQGYFARKGN